MIYIPLLFVMMSMRIYVGRPHLSNSEAYLEPIRISKMKYFAKILNGFKPLSIFARSFILEV